MPSIINSDDGVVSGTSGLKSTGGNDGLLNIQTNGSNAISISSGQRSTFPTTIGVGGATPSTSGSGISFPATQSASSDANTLDDYEEGTWTPTVSKGTISPSNSGYRKIGSQVTVWTVINTFSDRTSADAVVVGGLPFTANTSFDDVCCGSAMWRYSNVDGGSVYLNSSNGLEFYAGTTNGEYTAVKHNSLNNGSAAVHLCATYITSA